MIGFNELTKTPEYKEYLEANSEYLKTAANLPPLFNAGGTKENGEFVLKEYERLHKAEIALYFKYGLRKTGLFLGTKKK